MDTDNILLDCQSNIKGKLIDAGLKSILVRLVAEGIGYDITQFIEQKNSQDTKAKKLEIIGSTPGEIVENLAVDEIYNLIINDEKLAGRLAHYLQSKRVSFNKKDIKDSLNSIRIIRNHCAHVKKKTNIKNAVQGARKIITIREFMDHFKLLYVDIYDSYSKAEAELLDILKDYAEKHGEKMDNFQEVFAHSGMIDMNEFAVELSETELGDRAEEDRLDAIDKLEKLVYLAILEQNIIHRELRFAKSQADIVRKYILNNASKLELSISSQEKEKFEKAIDEAENAPKRIWYYDETYGIDAGDLLNLINNNNIVLDIRCLSDYSYILYLINNIIPYMSRESFLFASAGLNEYNLNSYGQGNTVYDEFINNYGSRITLFGTHYDDEADNLLEIISEHNDRNFLIITRDSVLKDRFSQEPINATILKLVNADSSVQYSGKSYDNNSSNNYQNQSVDYNVDSDSQTDYAVQPMAEAYINTAYDNSINMESVYSESDYIDNSSMLPEAEISQPESQPIEEQNISYTNMAADNRQEPSVKRSGQPLFDKKEVDPYLEDEVLEAVGNIGSDSILIDKAGRPVKLLDRLGGGGEGDVYDCTREGVVAKIYSPHANTRNRRDKLELMSSRQIDMPGICWPIDTLYNGNGQFVGYLMPKVSGIDFDRMVSNIGKPMERRGWDRKKLVTCLINIMSMFEYLHKNNIIVGDINGSNIMIESYDKVYLVDTDSFQLDKYPCQVEKQIYMDPTLRITEGEKHAYTKEEDQYKLAIIAYLMLMPGQMPYAINEGEAGGVFRFTKKGATTTAKPLYNYIWSNMERSVRNLFLRVFDNDERNITAKQWIAALKRYLVDIGDDEERNKIRIEAYRGSGFEEDIKCSRCGGRLNYTKEDAKERVAKYGEDKILCRDCSISDGIDRSKTVYMRCNRCKRLLTVSETYIESRRARGNYNINCDKCGQGKGAIPVYNVPRLSEIMLEMGD